MESVEVVDGELVPREEAAPVAPPPGWRGVLATTGGRQAAVAASSFVAGAVALAYVNHKRAARPSLNDIIGTDHYLIDVHRLRRS